MACCPARCDAKRGYVISHALMRATCWHRGRASRIKTLASFPDVQLHIVDAPLGAGPESILPVVVMDSGLARSLSSGRALRGPVGAPRNDGVNFRQSS